MIIQLYNWLKKKYEDIVVGLAIGLGVGLLAGLLFGLAAGLGVGLAVGLGVGLVFGLVAGLGVGLVFGLRVGLVFGLGVGLAVGLAVGLVFGLVAGLANLPQLTALSWGWSLLIVLICTLILGEILYLIFTPKIKKINYTYVLKHKADNLFSALLIIINVLNIVWVVRHINLTKYFPAILKWIGYIGTGLVVSVFVTLIIIAYLKINMELKRKK